MLASHWILCAFVLLCVTLCYTLYIGHFRLESFMPTMTIRLSEEEQQLIKEFAVQEKRAASELVRLAILERIEDAYDLRDLRAAKAAHAKDPEFYSHEEIMAKYGLE